jgi:hypothetical protein
LTRRSACWRMLMLSMEPANHLTGIPRGDGPGVP